MPRVGVVINPKAGGNLAAAEMPELEKTFLAAFPEALILRTTKKGEGTSLARRALREGCDWIISVGGDGTLNEVVNGIVLEEVPFPVCFSFIMMGRGNDFRRNFPSAQDWRSDLSRLLQRGDEVRKGRADRGRPLDVGKVTFTDEEGKRAFRYFVNHASCGVSAEINLLFNTSFIYRKMRGLVAYTLATLQALLRYRNRSVCFKVDNEGERILKAKLILISNGKTVAGGMKVSSMAELADGLLDITVFGDLSRPESIIEFPRIINGSHLKNDKIFHLRARSIEILPVEGENLPMNVEMDGEVVGTLPAAFEILPARLNIIV